MTHKPITFAEAYKNHLKKTQQQNTKDLTPSKNPDLYAPLLMPPEGYFDHIGAKRAKRAQERIPLIIEHLTKEPAPTLTPVNPERAPQTAHSALPPPASTTHSNSPHPAGTNRKNLARSKQESKAKN